MFSQQFAANTEILTRKQVPDTLQTYFSMLYEFGIAFYRVVLQLQVVKLIATVPKGSVSRIILKNDVFILCVCLTFNNEEQHTPYQA